MTRTRTNTRKRTPRKPEPANELPSAAPFPYHDYVRARDRLVAACEATAFFGQVLGFSGTGKTSLRQDLAAILDPHRCLLLYVSASKKTSLVGLARFLAQALHVTPRRAYHETAALLTEAIKAHPASLVLWIDEANHLCSDTLTELRILAECDGQPEPVFSVVLSGLPELQTTLNAPALFPLKRRISVRCVLRGLHLDELEPFLVHRLGTTGARRLPPGVRSDLFERTQAIPALLATTAALALELAGDTKPVRDEHLRAALDALSL